MLIFNPIVIVIFKNKCMIKTLSNYIFLYHKAGFILANDCLKVYGKVHENDMVRSF